VSAPAGERALVTSDVALEPRDGGFSPRRALGGALARTGLGGAALALACWMLQGAGFALATGYGLPDTAARFLMLAAYFSFGAACGLVHSLAGSALGVVDRVERGLQTRLEPQMTGLLARMFPNTRSITIIQIEAAVDRLVTLAADPSRPGLPRMLLGWALRRGAAALLREARARAGADGRLTLAEASTLIRRHLVGLVMGQLRSRLAIARQLALWIPGLAVLGPAAWLALRSA
jgi:hypothetical protein